MKTTNSLFEPAFEGVRGIVRTSSMELGRSNLAHKKNSDPVQKCFLRGGWVGQCSQLRFFQTAGIV